MKKEAAKYKKGTRSYTMSRIRAVDTKPEMALRRYLYHHGIRYRLHLKRLPGRPDVTISNRKIAIFVNGCFWHGHGCSKAGKLPSTNSEFWKEKFARNKARDARNRDLLISSGWKVITLWECQINEDALKQLADEILNTQVSTRVSSLEQEKYFSNQEEGNVKLDYAHPCPSEETSH